VLAEAEQFLGASPVLERERHTHAVALGLNETTREKKRLASLPGRTAWEHYALGRSLLMAQKYAEAAREFEESLALSPQRFWTHFYLGVCSCRLKRFEEALQAFGACIALVPKSAECYHNRALAYAASGDTKRALRDCERALQLSRNLVPALY